MKIWELIISVRLTDMISHQLIRAILVAKRSKEPIVLHVITKKGKGYAPAEKSPSRFHGVGRFDVASGEMKDHTAPGQTYTEVFSMAMVRMAQKNPKITAITAAMPDGTGLTRFFAAVSFPVFLMWVSLRPMRSLLRQDLRPPV